ncbi:MAG: hypothetical protein IJD40_06880 [Lachnospiraceae bacterium]|nr:hypothetical protein [Lachnospiraceae bacterium]
MVLKKNQSKTFHIISMIIGIILVVLGTIIYSLLYRNNLQEFSYENIAYMVVCIETIMFGIVLELINFDDGLFWKLVLVIVGFLIAGFVFNESFRFGLFLFAGTMLAYFITMRFKNIFSTVVTMSVCATIFLIITIIVLKLVGERYGMLALYGMFSLFIVVYRIFGKIINQWFIAKMLGFEDESKAYDDEQLKNQILLMYMLIFVCLNVWLYQEQIDAETWNLINNSFLTGLAIIQIDWNKIVFYFSKCSNKNIVDEEPTN